MPPMTSTVLARKYRPHGFDAMVGQEHVVQALRNALLQGRLHHAYLFTGTRGVGKTTVSRILAKALNCVGPDGGGGITAEPCGVCQACRDIDAGRFVDYVELDAASNRGVEEISQLLEQAVYKPVAGRFKVYMIDEVHMLSTTAFNAMLKTLEEPPEYLKFVLATTDPQKVPVTVLSRCLQFNLRPMPPDTVQAHLARVLDAEQIPYDGASLRLLGRAARGSMRDALSLTDQAIAFGCGRLDEPVVRQMIGAVDRQHITELLDAVAQADGAAVVRGVAGLRRAGISASGTLEELATALQTMAVWQLARGAADGDQPDEAAWRDLAARFAPDETQLFYSLCLQARAELALAPDEYGALQMTLLRVLAFRPGGLPAQPGGGDPPPKAPGSGARRIAPEPAAPSADSQPVATLRATPRPEASPPPWVDAGPMSEPEPVSEPVREPLAAPHLASQTAHPTVATAAAVVAHPAPSSPLGDAWAALVRDMVQAGLIGALVRETAMQSHCTAHEVQAGVSHWQLCVARESLCTDAHRERLEHAMTQALGQPVRLSLVKGEASDTPALREQAERARRQAAAEQLIQEDATVRRLLSTYPGARIVPDSIRPL